MATDFEKRLNLVSGSPTFAMKIRRDGSAEVLSPKVIPRDDHEYVVAATLKLRSGQVADAVFIIADGGATHVGIYVRVQKTWLASDDPRLPERLGVPRDEIFPFDWSYRIPVANDIFHPPKKG
jgi:hypothetical protein